MDFLYYLFNLILQFIAVIVLHIVPNSTFFLKVVNHASNVFFTSQAYSDGQRNAI